MEEMKSSGSLRRKLYLAALLVGYFGCVFLLMYYTGITCVYKHFLGVPCPGCGMTRALICLLKLDFAGAWGYNPLIFAMPYVFLYLFCDWRKPIHKYILVLIAIAGIVNWIINIL